jgi:hypothetical protein
MRTWLFVTATIVGTMYSFNAVASSGCRLHAPIDGDASISENIKGHATDDTYSYLVKRDLFGDGTNFVVYPVYSKDWLLTAGRLRELVARDKANVIGNLDVPVTITVVQSPKDIKDFKPMENEELVCAQ